MELESISHYSSDDRDQRFGTFEDNRDDIYKGSGSISGDPINIMPSGSETTRVPDGKMRG